MKISIVHSLVTSPVSRFKLVKALIRIAGKVSVQRYGLPRTVAIAGDRQLTTFHAPTDVTVKAAEAYRSLGHEVFDADAEE